MAQFQQNKPDPNGQPTQPVRASQEATRRTLPAQPIPPSDPLGAFQPIRVPRSFTPPLPEPVKPRRKRSCCGCLFPLLLVPLLALLVYLLSPARENILIMGLDVREQDSSLGRTDTIILTQLEPLSGQVHMLSIPRDLWVNIPIVGENRINVAHFYAEAAIPGSGPQALIETIRINFNVKADHYVRIRFAGVSSVIDALGGITVNLEEPAGGLEAGQHRLDGQQALAFARERYSGDDFSRMSQGQLLLRSILLRAMEPSAWPRLPAAWAASAEFVDTDIPLWMFPRYGLTAIRAAISGIDSRTITREMTIPFTTDGGAQVLAPDWNQIHPLVVEMFGTD